MAAGGRTLGFIGWHIATTIPEMMGQAGIAAVYRTLADRLAEAVKSQWADAQLDGEAPMYGESWKRGIVLSALIAHQTRHRGQMTVLMRRAGLKVPGVSGPSKEEWAAAGMPETP